MKSRNRDINIFNMSALDLFASALGAFILIAVVLFPYFPNTGDSPERVATIKKELAKAQKDLAKNKDSLKKARQALKESVKFAILGIATRVESFVIVIDMSGSMEKYTNITNDTVSKILKPMKDKHKIGMMGYQGGGDTSVRFTYWNGHGYTANASKANKQKINRFSQGLASRFKNGTPTKQALIKALSYPVDAVILLSDGEPNAQEGSHQSIINDITRINNGRKEIHTVALGEYGTKLELTRFLAGLSRNNKGDFVAVAN